MNTNEYLEDLAIDLDLDDEELQEYVEEHFGDDPKPLDGSSYYFAFGDSDSTVMIFPRHLYDNSEGSIADNPLFPVEEICEWLNLESEDGSLYRWDPEISKEQVIKDLLEAGLTQEDL